MSKQSFTNRIRDPEQRAETTHEVEDYGRRNKGPLIIGAVLGLVVGLFIGWVVWPIQWDNAWPPDLAEKPQADYIAAVADAFVAARSDDAAEIAYDRLSPFGEKMPDALVTAEAYFVENPTSDSPMRITNIQELAASMQPVATATSEPPTDTAAEADIPAVATSAPEPAPAPEPDESSNWLQLALWLLAAFVLIVGGIWVLRAVMGPQSTQSTAPDNDDADDDDGIDEWSDADLDNQHHDQPDAEEAHQARADDADVNAGAAVMTGAAIIGGTQVDKVDTGSVATEETTADVASDQPLQAPGAEPVDASEENPNIAVRAGTAGTAADSAYYHDDEGYGFGPETELPEGGSSVTVIVDPEPESQTSASTDSDQPIAPESEVATGGALKSAFLASGREVGRYTATYYPMLDEYEEAFRIVDVDDGTYIGDCGMGVNMKYGLVQHNPEQVAALDVWLIDLVQGEAMSFHSHTLVSKYGAKNVPVDKTGDGKGDETGEAQPTITLEPTKAGDRFQIVGEDLLVDCEIVGVSYMASGVAEGVFQGLEANLVVSRKL